MGQEKLNEFVKDHQIIEKEDPSLIRLREFLDTEWGQPGVEVLLRNRFGGGGFAPIPVPYLWVIPPTLDLAQLVWQQTQTDAFLEEMWPSIKMMMGDNILNTDWTAQVLTMLAFFRVIQILPIILNGWKEDEQTKSNFPFRP